jgi:hypothetical protein
MPLCEAPPAIYATMPRPTDVIVHWARDIPTSARICTYFKAPHSTACFVPGIKVIIMPGNLSPKDEKGCLDHEYAHANGWRHPQPYSTMGNYK